MEYAIAIVAGAVLGLGAAWVYQWMKIGSVRERSDEILERARQETERIQEEAREAARIESRKIRDRAEKELEKERRSLGKEDRALRRRQKDVERNEVQISKKEQSIQEIENDLVRRNKSISEMQKEAKEIFTRKREELERISGLDEAEAKEQLLKIFEEELSDEFGGQVLQSMERFQEEITERSRELLVGTMQRCAADHTADNVVSTIDIPSDDMKGRVIGREGRNIRAFERLTGIDVVVDDTPGVIVVSGFDSVRREIARRAMEKLILDGRIHPARIEEIVNSTREEMDQLIYETGKKVAYENNVHGLKDKEFVHLGRLQYRTSHGQSVLEHLVEVSQLCGLMAGELKLDASLARRCGLLHDIGKAVDHESEGTHAKVGADFARRCDHKKVVVNAIAAHHGEVGPTSVYAVLVQIANEVSRLRPGSRRESLEGFVSRMEEMEEMAVEFEGVDMAHAIQAGRELRVVVDAGKVNDKQAAKICRDIGKTIESRFSYPGEVRVTLLRESRIVEYAR
ncbi:MAG: ribonuclease Y [Planctomycetota bacterium]|nr:ribonuclease Y [Planctomycetota bacterium]